MPKCGSSVISTKEISTGSEHLLVIVCENCGFEGFPAEWQ